MVDTLIQQVCQANQKQTCSVILMAEIGKVSHIFMTLVEVKFTDATSKDLKAVQKSIFMVFIRVVQITLVIYEEKPFPDQLQ
jgi:hypothetical protein